MPTPRRTVADKAFDKKLQGAVKEKDWPRVTRIFNQYGHYLELLEEDSPEAAEAKKAVLNDTGTVPVVK